MRIHVYFVLKSKLNQVEHTIFSKVFFVLLLRRDDYFGWLCILIFNGHFWIRQHEKRTQRRMKNIILSRDKTNNKTDWLNSQKNKKMYALWHRSVSTGDWSVRAVSAQRRWTEEENIVKVQNSIVLEKLSNRFDVQFSIYTKYDNHQTFPVVRAFLHFSREPKNTKRQNICYTSNNMR